MHKWNSYGAPKVAAHRLFQAHGATSADEAAERAEEHFANIDFSGFAFWKNVETLLQKASVRSSF